MTIISAPGIYDLPMDVYHSQCCDGPSISSSEIITLTNKSPAHLIADREAERESARKPDMGTAIHALVLEPFQAESRIAVLDFKDYRTDAAKLARDRAVNEGKTPLLTADYKLAKAAAERVLNHPVVSKILVDGVAERSFFAKDASTGIWVKARPDLVTKSGAIIDLKSVGDAGYDFIQRRIFDGGWFQQAPWHSHVVERVLGQPIRDFLWVCVEQDAPHAIRVVRPVETALVHGARLNANALKLFAECVRNNDFPDYALGVEDMGLADYAYFKLEAAGAREENAAMAAVPLAARHNANVFS